jgi:hypothetical protein
MEEARGDLTTAAGFRSDWFLFSIYVSEPGSRPETGFGAVPSDTTRARPQLSVIKKATSTQNSQLNSCM